MGQAMVPKDNVTSFSITVNGLLAVIVIASNGMVFCWFITVLRCKGVVKSKVASGPDREPSATWRHIVDIADNTQMNGWASVWQVVGGTGWLHQGKVE